MGVGTGAGDTARAAMIAPDGHHYRNNELILSDNLRGRYRVGQEIPFPGGGRGTVADFSSSYKGKDGKVHSTSDRYPGGVIERWHDTQNLDSGFVNLGSTGGPAPAPPVASGGGSNSAPPPAGLRVAGNAEFPGLGNGSIAHGGVYAPSYQGASYGYPDFNFDPANNGPTPAGVRVAGNAEFPRLTLPPPLTDGLPPIAPSDTVSGPLADPSAAGLLALQPPRGLPGNAFNLAGPPSANFSWANLGVGGDRPTPNLASFNLNPPAGAGTVSGNNPAQVAAVEASLQPGEAIATFGPTTTSGDANITTAPRVPSARDAYPSGPNTTRWGTSTPNDGRVGAQIPNSGAWLYKRGDAPVGSQIGATEDGRRVFQGADGSISIENRPSRDTRATSVQQSHQTNANLLADASRFQPVNDMNNDTDAGLTSFGGGTRGRIGEDGEIAAVDGAPAGNPQLGGSFDNGNPIDAAARRYVALNGPSNWRHTAQLFLNRGNPPGGSNDPMVTQVGVPPGSPPFIMPNGQPQPGGGSTVTEPVGGRGRGRNYSSGLLSSFASPRSGPTT